MKKTIIALMALASGTALAEDAALLWDLTYTGTNYAITDANGDAYTTLSYYNATSTTVEDGVCTTKGTGDRLLLNDSNTHGLTLGGDYSFVIQGGAVTNPSDWATLFGLGNINGTPNGYAQIKISDSSNGNLGIYGEDSIFSDISSTTQTPVGEMGTYILTMQANDDNTASTATLYYNGTVVCSASITDTENKTAWRDKDLAYFTIGGRLRDTTGSLTQVAITNVQLYSGVLSDSQIASLSVPEPTTATLSLLALAGLAARRRRR